MSSATHLRLNRERGGYPLCALSHPSQPEMPGNTRFHYGRIDTLAFIIDDQAKAVGGVMNSNANSALSMLQCISQGLSSDLDDLFTNSSPHRNFLTMGAVFDR